MDFFKTAYRDLLNRIDFVWRGLDRQGKIFGMICCAGVFFLIATWFVSPPNRFPAGHVFVIESGATLSEIADDLKTSDYIKSRAFFKAIVSLVFRSGNSAVAGDYVFERKLNVFSLARRIATGNHHLDPVRVTLQEGLNKFEVADILVRAMPSFNREKFLTIASEGYLFPDTYFFMPNSRPERVVEIMTENFERKLAPYVSEIEESGRSFGDVIAMASIVETEARQFETRRVIAGILWKRLDERIPLQVDVSFKYINGKATHDLTLADLEIDSPYNSYRYAGLPPTPIANPGLESILATLSPTETPYYFFLSDSLGEMHYAATFDEHRNNKQIYLR